MSVLVKAPEFDHYAISRVLGEGGMGIVFLAEDRRTGLPVAIKVMSRSLQDPELQARFMKETEILASINHRNIVRCYEIVRSREGLPSIVMEFLQGADFSAFEGRPFPELIPLMVQAAMGLGYLKERAILHRDLSPNNIMVTLVHERRLVKIVDFGVAKVLQEGSGTELTQTGEFLGKLAYASPELLTLAGVDYRSDIYSLGVIFFRLLTARRPLNVQNSRSYLEWVKVHENRHPLDFSVPDGNPPIPTPLSDLVEKMLARDVADRPQGYEEIIGNLVAVQSKAEAEGLLPDPSVIATLPEKAGGPKTGSASRAGSPSGGSGPSPASAPPGGSGKAGAQAFFDDGKFDFSEEATSAPTSVAAAQPEPRAQRGSPAPGAPAPANPAEEARPDWLAPVDYMEEMREIQSGDRPHRAAAHPLRVTEERSRPSAAAIRRSAEAQKQMAVAAARKKRTALLGGILAVALLGVAGFLLWRQLGGLLPSLPGSAPPPSAAAGGGENPAPFDISAGRVELPKAPGRERTSANTAALATAEGRRLLTSNVIGFLATPSIGRPGAPRTVILLAFRRPVDVSGLSRATVVRALDERGAPVPGLAGIEAEIQPGDDPTSAMRLRLLVRGDYTGSNPGEPGLQTVVLAIGPGTIEARMKKDLLSH